MKNIFIIIFTLFVAISFTACDDYGKPDSYIPYMGEDAPDNSTKVYINTQTPPINEYRFTASFFEKENAIRVQGDSTCKFTVKITSPATEKLVVKLGTDENYITEYNKKNKTNYILLSKNNYTISKEEVVIEAGQKESADSISIVLKMNTDITKIENPVILPIKIASVNGKTDNISRNLNGIVITGQINLILDNIDSSNKPIEGVAFNKNVVLESNKTSNLPVLIDGNLTGRYWYPSNTSTYLVTHLPQEEPIKGIIINTGTGSYQFASVRIATQRSSGQVIQGVFATQQVGAEHYIKFKTPVSAKSFRFENFLTLRGGAQPDIMEIRFVK